jgi:hypothetical protein
MSSRRENSSRASRESAANLTVKAKDEFGNELIKSTFGDVPVQLAKIEL